MNIDHLIEYKTNIQCLDYLMNVNYIEVFQDTIEQLGGKMNVRLICTINKSIEFQCGLVALGNGSAYITLNQKRMKSLGVKQGDEVLVKLTKDNSEFGMEMPVELSELLKQDEEGERRYLLLPKGKQRYIIYYINTVKSSGLRLERALMLINNLKQLTEGKESFREMLGKEKRP